MSEYGFHEILTADLSMNKNTDFKLVIFVLILIPLIFLDIAQVKRINTLGF